MFNFYLKNSIQWQNKKFSLLFSVLLGCLSLIGHSAYSNPKQVHVNTQKTPVKNTTPQQMITQEKIKTKTLSVEVNNAEIIRFERPVTEIFIANPEVADVQLSETNVAYVFGKKIGTTTLFALDKDGQQVAKLTIDTTRDLSHLKKLLEGIDPEGIIEVESVGGTVVLTGVANDAKTAENALKIAEGFLGSNQNVLNQMSIKAPIQVNLKVKIAEVKRNIVNKLGINWQNGLSEIGNFSFGVLTGRAPFTSASNLSTSSLMTLARPSASTDSDLNSIGFGFRDNRMSINSALDLLSSEGLVTILAEPNLVSVSGETASFLAGGEFPFPVPQDNGNTTIEFKQYGVSLAFTPTILQGNLISLRVRPEVSELDYTGGVSISNVTVPAILTRFAETTVELGSGQTFAIAGLLNDSVTSGIKTLPGLGDLPIIGSLFRSNAFQRGETELVILVTPYLVKPLSGKEMVLPTDGIQYATFAEQIFEQKLTKTSSQKGANTPIGPGGTRLIGAAGFSFE